MKKTILVGCMSLFALSSVVAQDDCTQAYQKLTEAHQRDIALWTGEAWCDNLQSWLGQKGVRRSIEGTEIYQYGVRSLSYEKYFYDFTLLGGKPIYMDILQQGNRVQLIEMPVPVTMEKSLPTPTHTLLSYDDIMIMRDKKQTQVPNEECWLYPERGIAYFKIIHQNAYKASYIQVFKPCTLEEYIAEYMPSAFIIPGKATARMK